MRREEKKKLSINRRIIVNHLKDLESVIDYLITKQIFKSSMRQEINKASQIKADRIRHTLDLLETKQVLAYQYFLEALVVTGNKHVADILEPDYSSSEQCRMVIERERIRGFHHTNEHVSSSSSSSETINLRFPVTCTQNHANESPYLSPSSSSNVLAPNNPSGSSILPPMHIQRIMTQNPLYLFNNPNSNFFKQHTSNANSMSSQSTSRSTSSSGCQSSNSMSPTISRSRSSSVTAFLNGSGRHICTSASANGLLTLTASSSNTTPCNMRTPVSVSGSPYDDSDQNSPSNYCATNFMPTPTYNIDWSDVNSLELDFHVQTSLPNIRKQLSPNEVSSKSQLNTDHSLNNGKKFVYSISK